MRRFWAVTIVGASLLTAACGARFPREEATSAAEDQVVAGGDVEGAVDAGGAAPGTPAGPAAPGAGVPVAGGTGAGTATGARTSTTRAGATSGGGGGSAANTAVDPGNRTGVTDTKIRLAYLLPLTGAASVPSSFDKGAEVYWKWVNKNGGIHGREVEVLIHDTTSSAAVGKQEAQKAIENEKVFAVVVLDRLENQQALGAYLDSRKVPNIEIQTPVDLAKDQEWTFGVTIDHGVQGRLIADYFMKVLGAKKVGVLYENAAALEPGVKQFTAQVPKVGGEVVSSQAVDPRKNDYSGEVAQVARSGATAVWMYMAPEPAAKIANQASLSGYHPTWFANSISWAFDLTFAAAPSGALAGARAFSPWLPLSDPRTQTYQNEYRRQYPADTPPDDIGIVGWGVGEIVAEGLRRAGKDLGQNGFRHAMQNLNFRPQVWAPLAFGPGVRVGADMVAVLKEQDGRWTLERDFTNGF